MEQQTTTNQHLAWIDGYMAALFDRSGWIDCHVFKEDLRAPTPRIYLELRIKNIASASSSFIHTHFSGSIQPSQSGLQDWVAVGPRAYAALERIAPYLQSSPLKRDAIHALELWHPDRSGSGIVEVR